MKPLQILMMQQHVICTYYMYMYHSFFFFKFNILISGIHVFIYHWRQQYGLVLFITPILLVHTPFKYLDFANRCYNLVLSDKQKQVIRLKWEKYRARIVKAVKIFEKLIIFFLPLKCRDLHCSTSQCLIYVMNMHAFRSADDHATLLNVYIFY